MHLNSLTKMKDFFDRHINPGPGMILDVGSRVVRGQERIGCYRDFVPGPLWKYIGADICPGINVDIVLDEPYRWQFPDESFDVVISGQVLEHVEYPWEWMKEAARVLKPWGKMCIIAPAVIHEHRYPVDCYRFYPDGMRALARYAGLIILEVERSRYKRLEDVRLIAMKGGADA